ncbi:DUF2213 domain-containing protein [Rodentibacter trehalosifermentans]|uniref:DUF2213 domain-containing protein n=1 Tax=Rodentibacter trehalosifermentans TaxID=1908263 RepID=UPI00098467E8|nr:DUF2213 domain-containing protein [Rodentibacter trehalosifermentans]OOF52555.1 hypothetical protein BKK53_04740 [Rodentibacter trehalosifermentans]
MVMRYDRLALQARRDDNGFIYDTPVLTRTGVFVYVLPDGSKRREYRPPDEVFKADSLRAYKGIPITDEHHGKVTKANAHLVIGSVLSEGRQDGNNLTAEVVIHNTQAVDLGKKELSVGYSVELEEKSGITEDGEAYDCIQRNIKPNHLAIVTRGRAGTAKLNLDAADAVEYREDGASQMTEKNQNLSQIRLDSGIEYPAAPEVIVEFNKLKQDCATAKTEKDKEAARADALQAKVNELEKTQEQLKQDAYNQAKARIKLEETAKSHKVEVKADSTDRQLQEAVISAIRQDGADLSQKSDAYIEAAFDMACAEAKAREDSAGAQRAALTPTQNQNATFNQDGTPKLTGRAAMLASRNQ